MKGHYHMNTLTQSNQNLNLQLQSTLDFSLSLLNAPFVSQFSHLDYGMMFTNLNEWIRKFTLNCLKSSIEKADMEFRNSPNRVRRYYVKQTRPRTIITVLGELTYTRTEYIDRSTGLPYIYIDRKLCLYPKQRYDCCVEAKAKELYADHNSMIKVGKILGEMVHSHFSLNPNRKYFHISRQTIFNLLHRVEKISTVPDAVNNTPDTLFIMADEKYIHLQGEHKENESDEEKKKKHKQMVKMAICFEGNHHLYTKNGEPTKRHELVNKFIYASCKGDRDRFWDNFLEKISHKYDLSKVKKIYILGDGANWIKNAVMNLSYPGTSVTFALDKFHAAQATNRMTTDDLYRELLTFYLYQNQREDFDVLADIIKKEKIESNKSLDLFSQNLDYLHNNWKAFQVMVREVKIGCAMEQAISHVLASPFASVPKSYGKHNLPIYLDSRIHLKNNEDLLLMHLKALDIQPKKGSEVVLNEKLDWSFFDNQEPNQTYTVHLKNRSNQKEIYRF